MSTRPTHPSLDIQALVIASAIDRCRETAPTSILRVPLPSGDEAHVVRVSNVLYLPVLGLQVVDDRFVPLEGIVNPWNLRHLQRTLDTPLDDRGGTTRYAAAFDARYIDAEVCILSNVYSRTFSHFTEELLKVVTLQRAGLAPLYVHTRIPPFAFEYLDALGVDRRHLLEVPPEPVVFRSALYTTAIGLGDLSTCPGIFFDLRDRLLASASQTASPYGRRLWLDRGAHATSRGRELVNSEEVAVCLDEYGIERLDIGSLSILQQIAVARDAEILAGPHGAAFVHCMSMRPRSIVIECFSPLYLNHCWHEICRLLRHRYIMLADSHTPHAPYRYAKQVRVRCEHLLRTLDAFVDDRRQAGR